MKPIFGIIHWRIKHLVVEKMRARSDVKIYKIIRENIEALEAELIEEMLSVLCGKTHE